MNKLRFSALAFAVLASQALFSQKSIKGKVSNERGEALPFAQVAIKNTYISSIANQNGEFDLKGIKDGTCVLMTHCIGYADALDTINLSVVKELQVQMKESNRRLDEIVVSSNRVNNDNGMAYANLDEATIKKQNLGQDAPYMLGQLTGVVVNSDAGNGVGYTGIRIRGSDATRINVTINGVPVNDAESQGTYYVDMPDLMSSVNNIQVQRGVGASSNGAGAFGATINFQTNQLKEKPYANLIQSGGSFNTLRTTLAAGTGLLNNKFTLDARASKISSDGYIDRAKSDLKSYYLAAGYYGKKDVLKFINFSGTEKTYQAWNYVLQDSIQMGNRTFNSCGAYTDANGQIKYYNNETDNYTQNNFQLHYIHSFSSRLNLNVSGHYTKGVGYYEQYKQNQNLANYKMQDVITVKGDTIITTDLVRRLWLDNDFAGGIFNMNYTASSKLNLTLGGGYNSYFGKHFNRVIWARTASNSEIDHQYDLNTANKNAGNIYLKLNFKPIKEMNVFVDMQARQIDYKFLGFDDANQTKMQNKSFTFFNPKLGISYNASDKLNLYASLSTASKEPNRDDFVQAAINNRPKAEQLTDLETGFRYENKGFYLGSNLYYMDYKNQLVLNGQINAVGAYNRVNVAKSFRRGIEIEASAKLNKYFQMIANCSISENKIQNFVEFIDSSDVNYTLFTQYKKHYKLSDISFSPNLVACENLVYKPFKHFEMSLIYKQVSRQYLDNTSNIKRSIQPYAVLDFRMNYQIVTKAIPEITMSLAIHNLLNKKYETNGYTYSYYSGSSLFTQNYLATAAPTNFLLALSFKF
ncbi:MAG: TonB-dependent receptor [Bacteroidota bacterium]